MLLHPRAVLSPAPVLTDAAAHDHHTHHRLKMHKGWWSVKEPAAQITVVTGLNPSRLNQLEAQCKRWRGPLSAAVYQVTLNVNKDEPLPEEEQKKLTDAAAAIDEFHARCVRLVVGWCELRAGVFCWVERLRGLGLLFAVPRASSQSTKF